MEFISELTELESYNIPDGSIVEAAYLGKFKFLGIVVNSRAKYGTKKCYYVVLLNDMHLPFCDRVYYKGQQLSVDNDEIIGYAMEFGI